MNLKEFNAKVSELKAKGLALAQEGKIEEAEATKNEIETLTAAFEAE